MEMEMEMEILSLDEEEEKLMIFFGQDKLCTIPMKSWDERSLGKDFFTESALTTTLVTNIKTYMDTETEDIENYFVKYIRDYC